MKLLALETSTERMSLGLQNGDHQWTHEAEGGAMASSTLIPAIMDLLHQADLRLPELQAICFGRGPGAFTGLRTACAVAQGLALGADLPVLPIDTLHIVAEAARSHSPRVLVVMDARMNQVYTAAGEWLDGQWHSLQAPQLAHPSQVQVPAGWHEQGFVLAGTAWGVPELQTELQTLLSDKAQAMALWPQASALLRLGAASWQRGEALPADQALPVYVRDQVALTTQERLALKAATP